MKFKILDYSDTYFKVIAKKPVPGSRCGKFVQLADESGNVEYLVLSPSELSSYHANILERFCLLNGIEGAYASTRKDRFDIYAPGWYIIGGGKWAIDDKDKRLTLFDGSGVYGKFDPKGLRKKILDTGKMQGYQIAIT